MKSRDTDDASTGKNFFNGSSGFIRMIHPVHLFPIRMIRMNYGSDKSADWRIDGLTDRNTMYTNVYSISKIMFLKRK